MKYLVSALLWLTFVATSPLLFVIGVLLLVVTGPFDPDRRIIHAFNCRATFSYLKLNPWWDIRVEGRERIPQGACVLVCNHQSMADVLVTMGLFRQFKYVSKASLFALPIVGWMMTLARYVRLERGRHRSMARMMDECRSWLGRGMPVLIFPEGTYSERPELLPFKRGAFVLAIEKQVPVVPILLEGTTGLIVGDGPWLSPRCAIRVRVQEPISPAALGPDAAAAARRTRAYFAERLGRPDSVPEGAVAADPE